MISNTSLIDPILRKAVQPNGKKRTRSYIDEKKYFFFFKRVLDVLSSLVFLVAVMTWLAPIVALLIKINSPGPVFFLQKRSGRYLKTFWCFKFRTMVLNDEADDKPASENDYRVTAIGKFLRKTNIDEFPQFLNVLLGHMSIVGPRPHMLSECNRFSSLLLNYKFRSIVKPGITGLAQVKGFHGPAVDQESIFRRYQWDAFYVRNASWWLDLRIIYRTMLQWLHYLLLLIKNRFKK
jgi:lipopolysaccharide/colanic/teichoic acid biosynthesis glycosyltransferase